MISYRSLLTACTLPSLLASLLVVGDAVADGTPRNWPMPPSELERRFATEDFRILEVKGAGGGVTGASKLLLEYPDGKTLKVKWKSVPDKSADGWNNSPRKELAAYQVQRWIVDENDFIVPTAAPHCIPLADYAPIAAEAKPSLPGSNCVLGILAVWMNDVTAPEEFWDEKRFASDPLYAHYMADFNVLTYLIEHRDGRRGNLLLSSDPADPRAFAVDNGIAFNPFPWNPLVINWHKFRVPWVRRATIDKLRHVTKAQLNALGVVGELALDGNGVFKVVPAGGNLDDDKGVRRKDGRVQFGLTEDEIEDLEDRIESLIKDVDKGRIQAR